VPSSLLALLDDITGVLDDVAALAKVATRKTAGVLGDDLALNAQQVTGVNAERELPVVWAVAKGSLLNKSILVPVALLLSAFLPWAITPLMIAGGLFLCFEGAEKLVHRFLHRTAAETTHRAELLEAVLNPSIDLLTIERDKIKGAIRTDFILSAEIIVITLGSVAKASFPTQVIVLIGISLLMTVGVYGLVAGIVRLDDAGFALMRQASSPAQAAGRFVVKMTPYLMKALSVAGTAAMFLVGGGILTHGIPALHHLLEQVVDAVGQGGAMAFNALAGLAAGLAVVMVVALVRRVRDGWRTRERDAA
jgi:uncharacterized protein